MIRRITFRVSGLVQGVGFRPCVHRLAVELHLGGFVRNDASDVLIELEGTAGSLEQFPTRLREQLPPLARIDHIDSAELTPIGDTAFRIEPSATDPHAAVRIGADVATCSDCLAELFDPADRRFRYPFLNCTNCGPRFTIVRSVPYDRANTTMNAFLMCAACRREYDDPADRRFHAEPTACPACGPRLQLLDDAGRPVGTADPLVSAVEALRHGRVVAIKGLGGYHLACRANDPGAVAELRRRKHRDEKPFAIMCLDLAHAATLCEVSDREASLLASAARPIVLLNRRSSHTAAVAPSVAPGNPSLGVMFPYTPLHHLLMAGMDGESLVMTSGNRSDEPIAFDDADALRRLAGIADLFLTHDRAIHLRCDDSVARVCAGEPVMLRRSRGWVPTPINLPVECPQPLLAVGGQLKNTFALASGRRVILSHHVGDLDDFAALQACRAGIDHFERQFAIAPAVIVHDLHPDYASTRYALERTGVSRIAVQHHHAHLAACLADNDIDEPCIGVIFDGTGYGTDGTVWGGEFLVGDCAGFTRAAHFRNVAMPGGEQAIRQVWRMAVAHLLDAGQDPKLLLRGAARGQHAVNADKADYGGVGHARHPLEMPSPPPGVAPASDRSGPEVPDALAGDLDPARLCLVETMIARRLNAPLTSSVGRLFDAVAAIAGLRHVSTYEGQAAIELEWAAGTLADTAYAFDTVASTPTEPLVIDTRPLIAAVAADARAGVPPARIAAVFHRTVVDIVAEVCRRLRTATGLDAVALSGGVFMNMLLLEGVVSRLEADRFRVHRHRQVPPNDGGLSLGQAAVAAARSM